MQFPVIDHQVFFNQRTAYAYPAVALTGSLGAFKIIKFYNTIDQDQYINTQLHTAVNDTKVIGYLSALFWGHYSGKDGCIRAERAHGKVNLAYLGSDRKIKGKLQRIRGVVDFGIANIAENISAATAHIAKDEYYEALISINKLPGISIAFASKICAFINPKKCGVIDSVIANRYRSIGFAQDRNGYVKNTVANRLLYGQYCLWLQQTAAALNGSTQFANWNDRNKQQQPWRAVDVERALYE